MTRKSGMLSHAKDLSARRARIRGNNARRARIRSNKKGPTAGPWRKVVYIFEREGERGGSIWWLVLECGHAVARKRAEVKNWTTMVRAMFEPIERRLAPKRCQCHYCQSGVPKADPWILVEAFGGPKQ